MDITNKVAMNICVYACTWTYALISLGSIPRGGIRSFRFQVFTFNSMVHFELISVYDNEVLEEFYLFTYGYPIISEPFIE